MPTYEHVCENEECKHEWEDTYSLKVDPPKICPKCGKETAKRLISLGGKGVVELTGDELIAKLKADGKQLTKEASKNANLYDNLLGKDKQGNSRYHNIQTQMDRRKKK